MNDLPLLLAGIGVLLLVLAVPAAIGERLGWDERWDAYYRNHR